MLVGANQTLSQAAENTDKDCASSTSDNEESVARSVSAIVREDARNVAYRPRPVQK